MSEETLNGEMVALDSTVVDTPVVDPSLNPISDPVAETPIDPIPAVAEVPNSPAPKRRVMKMTFQEIPINEVKNGDIFVMIPSDKTDWEINPRQLLKAAKDAYTIPEEPGFVGINAVPVCLVKQEASVTLNF